MRTLSQNKSTSWSRINSLNRRLFFFFKCFFSFSSSWDKISFFDNASTLASRKAILRFSYPMVFSSCKKDEGSIPKSKGSNSVSCLINLYIWRQNSFWFERNLWNAREFFGCLWVLWPQEPWTCYWECCCCRFLLLQNSLNCSE